MTDLKIIFDKEAECMDRIFHKYMVFSAISIKMRNEIMNDMPLYMLELREKYCRDCTTSMCLNIFLNKWRYFINNDATMLHYKEYITGKLNEYIERIKQRFDDLIDDDFRHLCGCVNYERASTENNIWVMHLETIEDMQGKFIGDIVTKTMEINSLEFNTLNDYKLAFENSLIWRNDLNKHLKELKSHQQYFKRVPHKVYRDNILVPLSVVTNSDCVNKILEYL